MRAFLVLAFLVPTAGKAEFFNGNKIHELCQTRPDIAAGYAAGLMDAAQTFDVWRPSGGIVCPDKHVTLGQAKDVMCNYIANNPSDRHLSASSLMLNAFGETFPCSQ